jgi:hypothetical protein
VAGDLFDRFRAQQQIAKKRPHAAGAPIASIMTREGDGGLGGESQGIFCCTAKFTVQNPLQPKDFVMLSSAALRPSTSPLRGLLRMTPSEEQANSTR